MDCGYAAVDENYRSYLFNYFFDNEENRREGLCITPLGYQQAIIYYRVGENTVFNDEPYLGYNHIPKCYGLMMERALEASGVSKVQRNPQLGYRGQGTLVAVIDTGINVEDSAFLFEDRTTKIEAYWDQTDQNGRPPENFSFGTEWDKNELNENLKEESFRWPRDENGHGTFLASVAAGRELGVAPDAGLIIVKLKQAKKYLRRFYSIPDGVWACQEDDVMLAIKYVIEKARQLNKPASICLGIGTNLGGHSGTDALERYISTSSLLAGISFHIAGGNEGIANHHYSGLIPEGDEFISVDFHVAEEENGFIMELWGKEPIYYSVGLLSPGGESIERIQIQSGEFRTIRFFPENTVLSIRSFSGETIIGSQVIRLNFTAPAPGVWKLFVYGRGEGERSFDIWMPISNFLKEETFFLNANSFQTITSPGNVMYGITYAPYDPVTDALYVRAGRGYTRDGRVVPDLASPGVNISIPGPNNRNIVGNGSSVAAAFGAGIGALFEEWAIVLGNEPEMNGQSLRYHLVQGAVRNQPYSYPNREWGYGIVNAYDAFLAMRT